MEIIEDLLPLLVPIVIIQLVLVLVALHDLRGRVTTRGPKWAWVLVILFVNFVGPILYFTVGRENE
jgi:hypothetical protein